MTIKRIRNFEQSVDIRNIPSHQQKPRLKGDDPNEMTINKYCNKELTVCVNNIRFRLFRTGAEWKVSTMLQDFERMIIDYFASKGTNKGQLLVHIL